LADGRLYVRNHSRAACLLLRKPENAGTDLQYATLSVSDIPQSSYFDWAAFLIPVEPEYAMDAPSLEWLQSWFLVCLSGLGVSVVVGVFAQSAWSLARCKFGNSARAALQEASAARWPVFWWGFLASTLVCGVLGTTLVSDYTSRFIFTWPLALFVLFLITISFADSASKNPPTPRWMGYLVLALFLGICAAYFVLCRRMSLAFEWVFLVGFPVVVPFALAIQKWRYSGWLRTVIAILTVAVAFAAYYWSSVGVLIWRYQGGTY